MSRLSRRQFVVGAGSAALLAGCGRLPWQAQQPAKVPRIVLLGGGSHEAYRDRHEAFRQGLRDLGYVEDQNFVIESRMADGYLDRLPELAGEVARLPVDVIVVSSAAAVAAAKQATTTIPIVIAESDDPVERGFVASLARPGGNITGLSHIGKDLAQKRLELLKAMAPGASLVAVLWTRSGGGANIIQWTETRDAAQMLGVQLQSLEVQDPDDIERVLEATSRERLDALIVVHSGPVTLRRAQIIDFAAKSRLPAIYGFREYVEAGGLIAYGPNLPDMYRRAAYYVDRILKGTKPADLPVEQPMRFDFVVNMRTARELGITFPHEVALQITEVIE
jgi:putative ABC transport system substrate-binding protein